MVAFAVHANVVRRVEDVKGRVRNNGKSKGKEQQANEDDFLVFAFVATGVQEVADLDGGVLLGVSLLGVRL